MFEKNISCYWKCTSDNLNAGFYDFPFEYDQILIAWWKIYCINDNFIERLHYSSIVELYLKIM